MATKYLRRKELKIELAKFGIKANSVRIAIDNGDIKGKNFGNSKRAYYALDEAYKFFEISIKDENGR